MSDANRTVLRYKEETVWGMVPSGPPKFTNIRETGESLKGTKSTEVSEEIRADRQIPGVIRTGVAAEGEINFELSYGSYNDFLRALLMAAAWSSAVTVLSSGTASASSVTKKFTHSVAWTVNPTVGQWIRTNGFTNAGNNGYFKVKAVSNTEIEVHNSDGLVTEAGATGITIKQGAQIVNGVAAASFAIEREHEDLANVFELYRGMMPEGLSLDIPVDGRITGSFSFMGKDEQATAATAGDGSPTAANENDMVSSANDIQFIAVDHGSVCLLSGSIEVTNNLRPIRCAGELANHAIGVGRFGVTGDVELLFSDHTQKTKYLAHTEIALAIAIEDAMVGALGLGNGMIMELPSAHISDNETVAGGVDTELSESLSIEAFMNPSEDITMRIAVWPAE